MKKVLCIALIALMLLSLCSCGLFGGKKSGKETDEGIVGVLTDEYEALLKAGKTEAAELVLKRIGDVLTKQKTDAEANGAVKPEDILSEKAQGLLEAYYAYEALGELSEKPDISSYKSFDWGK